ncbi:MAG: hypothetical protein GTO71_11300 [Woeseiaceae bacterium]|nr:hypothetical protein [Woeseiaceae bacterium]NIP21653.1 hypothetical protein [Woeseiaceae bacterium]
MERLVQLLDDLDDFVAAIFLLGERIRARLMSLLAILALLALQAGGIILAIAQPPLALALASMLFVSLLYRSATAAHEPLEIA